ncbi:MAG: HEPN domain-containing protein [bacterium]|nr:HEPN domain-containing protein [bacterium]
MTPQQAEDWIAIARERGADAAAMLPARQGSSGPVYMSGYAIECSLKAYLQRHGIAFPRSGREGHDLKSLWRVAGFKLRDLGDRTGAKSFYVEGWSVDLRYAAEVPSDLPGADLVEAAGEVAGWIQSQIRRRRRPKK